MELDFKNDRKLIVHYNDNLVNLNGETIIQFL